MFIFILRIFVWLAQIVIYDHVAIHFKTVDFPELRDNVQYLPLIYLSPLVLMNDVTMFLNCNKFFFFVSLRTNGDHGLYRLEVSRSHTTTHHIRCNSCR